jgi:hypothetical protein
MRNALRTLTARRRRRSIAAAAMTAILALGATALAADQRTGPFSGAKVNGGTVTATKAGNGITLTLSDDFQVPDTPAPHWQVVDSRGNVYLLQRLKVKGILGGVTGDKLNRVIMVPPYVQDVAKVQIWCAWAEVLLGEASFSAPVR